MKHLFSVFIFSILLSFTCFSQGIKKEWNGYANIEFSRGITGYANDFNYMSAGVSASYGMIINEHYFLGLGIKPNYIFSDGDFEGFFLPVYGEFKYESSMNDKHFGGFGVARIGYSIVDQRGIYAHIGGGLNYKKWEFGLGITYQYTKFKEDFFDEVWYNNYNLVFGTISVGYNF